MIGIGIPIRYSSMERITSASSQAPPRNNDSAGRRFRQSATAAVPGSALCSRRPRIAARSMIAAA